MDDIISKYAVNTLYTVQYTVYSLGVSDMLQPINRAELKNLE